jgi:hypothetical protein
MGLPDVMSICNTATLRGPTSASVRRPRPHRAVVVSSAHALVSAGPWTRPSFACSCQQALLHLWCLTPTHRLVLVLVRLLGAPPTGGTHLESNEQSVQRCPRGSRPSPAASGWTALLLAARGWGPEATRAICAPPSSSQLACCFLLSALQLLPAHSRCGCGRL